MQRLHEVAPGPIEPRVSADEAFPDLGAALPAQDDDALAGREAGRNSIAAFPSSTTG
jgi:hypothetical protein